MGFLGIGTWEILLIIVLALIILGPGKLTEFARTLGKTVRAIKKASAELTTAVAREMDATRNEPPPSPPKEEKIGEVPSAVNTATTGSHDDQPTKAGGAPQAK